MPQAQGNSILVLVVVILGVAVFCFTQGYIAVGIICLAGFSKKFGWPALIATSVFLFVKGHWITGTLPILLILWNIVGLRILYGRGAINRALGNGDHSGT